MGLNYNGVGVIAVICKCGFKLYWYSIGDATNRNKFNGPPTPSKAMSGYDEMRCPSCRRKLSPRPERLIFMSQKEFNERYVVGEFKLMNRVKPELVSSGAVREGLTA
ncbi:MAG: hypothetical protein NZ902_02825 [Acidilobaceae archaeon]|nr:hypothetical protein [Acidilobaceae archaeon]MCX8165754.1 hypothetical protein [Acidilobaceae archaeon]MDW7974179.1 hypothetical protein [Sulfolobales archaeon]